MALADATLTCSSVVCVELLWGSRQPMTGRLATRPSNTTQHSVSLYLLNRSASYLCDSERTKPLLACIIAKHRGTSVSRYNPPAVIETAHLQILCQSPQPSGHRQPCQSLQAVAETLCRMGLYSWPHLRCVHSAPTEMN